MKKIVFVFLLLISSCCHIQEREINILRYEISLINEKIYACKHDCAELRKKKIKMQYRLVHMINLYYDCLDKNK